ncbi:rod shape-determining protein MreD [Celeribacter sp.]|uniref:rod shape-determining protein MreD n=1 Tax=Celeribacter sp. TaxID=1890673 RepID=UPI003A9123CE
MVDPRTIRKWGHRAAFLAIFGATVFVYLLPLSSGTGHWPGPDVALAVAFAWVLRRPDFLPLFVAAPVFFLSDVIFLRPPGLWAAISIIGLEFLRRREPTSRDMPFLVEWAMVGGVLVAMAVLYRATLAVFMVDQTSLGLVLLEQVSTLAAYPLVVLISSKALSVTKLTPTEADELMRQS